MFVHAGALRPGDLLDAVGVMMWLEGHAGAEFTESDWVYAESELFEVESTEFEGDNVIIYTDYMNFAVPIENPVFIN